MSQNEYVYGPVPSRRLGRSLGIDLVPFKTCSYDCIYCQLGRTTCKSVARKDFVSVDKVITELEGVLKACPEPDCITIAGSGEPTLHSGIGEVIQRIKEITVTPVVVLTNGSLMGQAVVRDALMTADVVVPSLDAGDPDQFQRINRPHPEIDFGSMCEGLEIFTREFGGEVWLEIFLLAELTDTPESVQTIVSIVERIAPARVQLNTVCRPPAERSAMSITLEQMLALKALFPCRADIIGASQLRHLVENRLTPIDDDVVIALIGRRPCSTKDVADGLGVHLNEALKYLNRLTTMGRAQTIRSNGKLFYVAAEHIQPDAMQSEQ